jgi:AraC-like DNA-binding protein
MALACIVAAMPKPPRQSKRDARETAAVIPANVLVHLLGYADRCGVDSRRWFAGLGLTRAQLLDPQAKMSYRQVHTLLMRALEAFDRPGLGLIIGSIERSATFGLLGLLMMTAATFGEAMRLGIEHHEVSGSLLDMSFEQLSETEVALAFWPRFDDPALQAFLCEEVLASSLMLVRELVGSAFKLNRVELTYAAPPYAALYREVLDTRVQFDAPHNRAVLDAHWLAKPLPGHNPLAARQALELCRQQLEQVHAGQQEIVAAVEHMLRTHPARQARIGDVARGLHLSERSLRRKLAAANCAFSELRDRVRTEHAFDLLRGSRMSVADVASALGFSDSREFRRAFKRWTGMAPQAARRRPADSHPGPH